MRTKRTFVYILALLFVAAQIVAFYPGRSASALSGSQFQAGRIIDDAVFYNKGRMTTSAIQAFLNAKVPVCDTNGSQAYGGTTRAAYGSSQGYPPPYTCLKSYSKSVPAKSADEFCGSMTAGTKTAAKIIYDVAQACGINPQVFLVLLQKEQSLVTDDWPWSKQYQKATGFGCPDTAPCDPAYAGFFNQIYQAGRGFKRYAQNQEDYNYRSQRNNNIRWHPNTSCGSSTVFINNKATASLYIYTPYRPNQAALNNLYGTGNSCSSYGNRNFWRMFWDWFGNTHTTSTYSWHLESQEIFKDAGRTQRLNFPYGVTPNQTFYLRVKATNMGSKTWEKSFLKIAPSQPGDRTSAFHDSSWLSASRTAAMMEDTVTPGGTATFEFAMTAPAYTASFLEHFSLLAEGKKWLNDEGMYYGIDVSNAVSSSNATNTTLTSGQEISAGEYMLSPDRHSTLYLQKDGNLVLYEDFQPLWSTATASKQGERLVMQADGNLVLYSKTGGVLWHSGTYSNPGARVVLQYDGHLVIYSGSTAIWTKGIVRTPSHLAHVNTTLYGTQMMLPGQQLETANREVKLVLQNDGNLVLSSSTEVLWMSKTYGKQVSFLNMQSDGNLVLYSINGRPLWKSNTSGHGGSLLRVQPDGNLVMYRANGSAAWSTGTSL